MLRIADVKWLLFIGYLIGYPAAVLPPIFFDPLLTSHTRFGARTYPYASLCILIYGVLIFSEAIILLKARRALTLYVSDCVFLTAIALSLPIFRPEFPHGNLMAVGAEVGFLSLFTIFVWWTGQQIIMDSASLNDAGHETFEYLKGLLTFVRQAAFAGVALFGALFFAAYSTGFTYIETTVTSKADQFLLRANVGFQIVFVALYAVIGVIRYFFVMNLQILSQSRELAFRLDRKKPRRRANRNPP